MRWLGEQDAAASRGVGRAGGERKREGELEGSDGGAGGGGADVAAVGAGVSGAAGVQGMQGRGKL